ncbi:MAG: AAA family ATPase [Minisyncoccia bacterium]
MEIAKIIEGMTKDLESKTNSLVSVEQILKHDFGPELWTVAELIPQESITAITGAPKSFKTWLVLDIAKCIAKGTDFLGKFKTSQGRVLIIDRDNNLRHIQKRLKMLGFEKEEILYHVGEGEFQIDKDKDFQELLKTVSEQKISLVILDSLVRIHSGDENESRYINKLMTAFRKVTTLGATIIFLHHNRKESLNTQSTTNSVRGSSDIFAGLDCLLQVTKPEKDSLYITQSKLRTGEEMEPFKVQINKTEESMELVYAGKSDFGSKDTYEVKIIIAELLEDKKEMTREEIIKEFSEQYKPVIINLSLKELELSEKIIKKIGPHNKHSYVLNANSTLKSEKIEVKVHNPVDMNLLKKDN